MYKNVAKKGTKLKVGGGSELGSDLNHMNVPNKSRDITFYPFKFGILFVNCEAVKP